MSSQLYRTKYFITSWSLAKKKRHWLFRLSGMMFCFPTKCSVYVKLFLLQMGIRLYSWNYPAIKTLKRLCLSNITTMVTKQKLRLRHFWGCILRNWVVIQNTEYDKSAKHKACIQTWSVKQRGICIVNAIKTVNQFLKSRTVWVKGCRHHSLTGCAEYYRFPSWHSKLKICDGESHSSVVTRR